MLPELRRVHVRFSPRADLRLAFSTAGAIAARAWAIVSRSPFSCWVTSVVPLVVVWPMTWM